ncbi:DUF1963 domain-containing protein [Jannaschia aquimarina]|uniref:DUF1963 domain-containing protein n=1 Tax=Jannaschia aquimarina TaxID=935700 RepID=A0A0D1ENC8_9RHOB|nr:DUF1963 domain-containing protein [Jannaschia aquimarina]KIT17185.1 hypothetical protein jaqu_09160 [Jannaschia aquimarina]SNT18029.1 protein of unknown function [Jannaschia aquimarina]
MSIVASFLKAVAAILFLLGVGIGIVGLQFTGNAGQGIMGILLVLAAGATALLARALGRPMPAATERNARGRWGDGLPDEPTGAQAKDVLRDVVEQNSAVLAHEQGDLPHHAGPVALEIALPGEPGSDGESWIGGEPALPANMDWPVCGGVPMQFIAQIALEDLPEETWGGLGPRAGWLVVFAPLVGRLDRDLEVFHICRPVTPRPYPQEPAEKPYSGYGMGKAFDLMREVGVPTSHIPMRWPLRVERIGEVPQDRLPRRSMLRAEMSSQVSLDDPAWHPFDGATARVLVGAARRTQDDMIGLRGGYRTGEDPDLIAASRASREAAITALDDLARDLPEPSEPLGEEQRTALLERLDAIRVMTGRWDPGEKRAVASDPIPVMSENPARTSYATAFEYLARDLYRRDPNALPDAQHASLVRIWGADAEAERAYMGGPVPEGYPYSAVGTPALLLEVPSSDLIGWMWGDCAKLGIFIKAPDLAAGRFDRAWGDVLN